MPITHSAKKALRKDRRRTVINKRLKERISRAVKKAKIQPAKKTLSFASSILDRAAKKKLIHKNKAARLKSRLAKMFKSTETKASSPKSSKRRAKS